MPFSSTSYSTFSSTSYLKDLLITELTTHEISPVFMLHTRRYCDGFLVGCSSKCPEKILLSRLGKFSRRIKERQREILKLKFIRIGRSGEYKQNLL